MAMITIVTAVRCTIPSLNTVPAFTPDILDRLLGIGAWSKRKEANRLVSSTKQYQRSTCLCVQTLSFLEFVGTWPVQVTTYLATHHTTRVSSVCDRIIGIRLELQRQAAQFDHTCVCDFRARSTVISSHSPPSGIRAFEYGKKLFRPLSFLGQKASIQLFRPNGPNAWNKIEGQGSVPTSLLRGATPCCKPFCQDWSGWFED
ncbi:hypothetical protein BDR06DRAFT_1010923 [Suillus hirtellus]|nr:hypothetical protein BDR06DRAFT_1010923 [Suillus hirtellus]